VVGWLVPVNSVVFGFEFVGTSELNKVDVFHTFLVGITVSILGLDVELFIYTS